MGELGGVALRCDLLSDDWVVVIVRGSAEDADRDGIIDAVIEGCDAAGRSGGRIMVDARFARLEDLGDADRLFRELHEICAGAGVELALRRAEARTRGV